MRPFARYLIAGQRPAEVFQMNRLTKTIAAIMAVCSLSMSGVAFGDCSSLNNKTLAEVVKLLGGDTNESNWKQTIGAYMENVSCERIYFHVTSATTSSSPACAESTACYFSDESDGGSSDEPIECDVVSCN